MDLSAHLQRMRSLAQSRIYSLFTNYNGCQHEKKAWRPRKKYEMALVFWHPDGRPCWRRMENQLKKTMPNL